MLSKAEGFQLAQSMVHVRRLECRLSMPLHHVRRVQERSGALPHDDLFEVWQERERERERKNYVVLTSFEDPPLAVCKLIDSKI
jgi:hypothetical protein